MPYIKCKRGALQPSSLLEADTTGELNFQLTQLLIYYVQNKGRSYSTFNDVIGALEGAKLEFYRRVVAPYEDEKRQANGDVY